MFRKILLPVACAALLGGCASYGYSDGGYYYGGPSQRYYGSDGYGYYDGGYYGYPYRHDGGYGGYYGGGYYGRGYGGYYGDPYYAYPRYYYYRRGHHHGGHDNGDHDGNGNKPPWRRRWADDSGDMLRRPGPRPRPDAGGHRPIPGPRGGVAEGPRGGITRPELPRIDRSRPTPPRLSPRAMPQRAAPGGLGGPAMRGRHGLRERER